MSSSATEPRDARYVELFNLGKTFRGPDGPVHAVKGFQLEIARGELVALLGHSGCGKSTVLSMVAGLTEITTGSVVVAGKEISGPGPDRGVVFQAPCLLPWLTAYENVMLGLRKTLASSSAARRAEVAVGALARVGLREAVEKKPAELSLGMQQRVGIARAFALSPRMLLLDEPFGMLDSLTRMELQEALLELLETEAAPPTTLMVTHDVDEALFMADRVVLMTKGPEARVGAIIDVPFPRPRRRESVLEHPRYYELREALLAFLESQERPADTGAEALEPVSS